MNLTNCIRATEFIFVGFPENVFLGNGKYDICLFSALLPVSDGQWAHHCHGNLDHHLQKPMYFFLSILSCIDIGHTTSFIAKLLINYLSTNNSICFYCCITQLFFYFFFGITEFFIITLISLDRYLAICHPLRYSTIMTSGVCFKLAMAAWFGGFFSILYQGILTGNLPYCTSNIINYFYCDEGPLLKISGGDTHVVEAMGFLLTVVVIMFSLVFTLISYLFIICTILRMPSTTRQQRAFSTCASHLVVVSFCKGQSFLSI